MSTENPVQDLENPMPEAQRRAVGQAGHIRNEIHNQIVAHNLREVFKNQTTAQAAFDDLWFRVVDKLITPTAKDKRLARIYALSHFQRPQGRFKELLPDGSANPYACGNQFNVEDFGPQTVSNIDLRTLSLVAPQMPNDPLH